MLSFRQAPQVGARATSAAPRLIFAGGEARFEMQESRLPSPVRTPGRWLRAAILVFLASGKSPAAPPGDITNTALPDAATAASPHAHLTYAPGKPPPFWSVATAETIMARWPDYNLAYHASWTYVHGYALCAFERLYQDTRDARYLNFIRRFIDQHIDENGRFREVIDGRGRMRPTRFENLDNLMTGNTLVMLYERTGDARYKTAAMTMRRAFDD